MLKSESILPRTRVARLLLVDDEADVRKFYQELFDEMGLEVVSVGTVREAANAALDRPFDLAIVDERLPDGRGLALLRWLHRRFPGMRVILFSVFADWDLFSRGCDQGAYDVVSKVRPISELVRVVASCLIGRS